MKGIDGKFIKSANKGQCGHNCFGKNKNKIVIKHIYSKFQSYCLR